MSLKYILNKIRENNFLIIGRAGIDFSPKPPGTKIEFAKDFEANLGGSSANIAVALAKLGGNCKLLTSISDDALGKLAINQLNQYGVDTSLIKFHKNEARLSLAIFESIVKNHQSIIYRHGAADLLMNEIDINQIEFKNFSSLIFTGTCLAAEPSRSSTLLALKKAKNSKVPVIFDVDYRPYTWKSEEEASKIYLEASEFSNILIGNDDEFGVMAQNYDKGLEKAKELSKKNSIVIYKKGEKGSLTFYDNNLLETGIFPVEPLKPTGAGDAFMGGFIGALLNDINIEEAIKIGSASAAIVVTKVGCSSAMPLKNEIDEFIKNNKINKE